jgi:NADH:ubiquinone oxidoreductase subunit E
MRTTGLTNVRSTVSQNLVELIRRHHVFHAPTATDVLKAAMDDHGELTDDDRRRAAELSGLPEAVVYGVSSFYDDLVLPRGARHVRVCTGTACFAATGGSHVEAVSEGLGLALGERRADRTVSLAETVCLGFCHSAPTVRDGDVIDAGPDVVARLLAGTTRPAAEPEWETLLAEPVLTRPGDWSGLRRALTELTPESLLDDVEAAEVRGRGGAGFPAGTKWRFTRAAVGEQKFIVANGDEGDPGSYIDKYLMERNPAIVLEGLALAGFAVGAAHGFIMTRSEYPLSKPRLDAEIERARADGWLGRDILGTGFDFDIVVVEGAGSYVVGEETALLASLQGLRGTVSARPPFPAERGILGRPTVVNNIETLANIPFVAARGPDAYRGAEPRRQDDREQARVLQRALRQTQRLRGPVRTLGQGVVRSRGRWSARRSHAEGRPDRRPAGRDPARLAAGHLVRLRCARRRGVHGRAREHPRLRRHDEHAPRRQSSAALRRPRELRKVLPVPDRTAASSRHVRGGGPCATPTAGGAARSA